MSRINRVPKGLQSLLGTKALGRNPDEVSEVVRPNVDLTQNYLAEQGLQTGYSLEAGASAATGTQYATVEIPTGQGWYVYNVTTAALNTGAGSFKGGPSYNVPANAPANLIFAALVNDVGFVTTLNPGELAVRSFQFPVPTLFPAGTIFGSQYDYGTGTVTFRTLVTYARVDL